MLLLACSTISLSRAKEARLLSMVNRNVDCLELLGLLLCVAWAVVSVNWLLVRWNRHGPPRDPSATLTFGTIVLHVMVLAVGRVLLNGLVMKRVVVMYVWCDLVAVVRTGMLVVKKTLQPLPSGLYRVVLLVCNVRRTSQVTLLPPVPLWLAVLCAQYSNLQESDTEKFSTT